MNSPIATFNGFQYFIDDQISEDEYEDNENVSFDFETNSIVDDVQTFITIREFFHPNQSLPSYQCLIHVYDDEDDDDGTMTYYNAHRTIDPNYVPFDTTLPNQQQKIDQIGNYVYYSGPETPIPDCDHTINIHIDDSTDIIEHYSDPELTNLIGIYLDEKYCSKPSRQLARVIYQPN